MSESSSNQKPADTTTVRVTVPGTTAPTTPTPTPTPSTTAPASTKHPTTQTPVAKSPNWSDAHRRHLTKLAPQLAEQWIATNVDETTNGVTELIKRAYNDAFHAGAGANHALNEKGI